jgi:hypothetical protein
LDILNTRIVPQNQIPADTPYIASSNAEVHQVNTENLNKLSGPEYYSRAQITIKERHSDNIIKQFDSTLAKIKTKRNKFFDYSTKELLFLENEILLIIPFTKDIYSYNKNMFKKINIYFEKNKIDIDYFIPGCATVHQNNLLLITGGEYKDSSTSIFMILDIPTKKLKESVEMNFTRRFHSMLSMKYNEKNFICVLGGWDSKEVELLETTDNNYKTWMICHL